MPLGEKLLCKQDVPERKPDQKISNKKPKQMLLTDIKVKITHGNLFIFRKIILLCVLTQLT
jgi:hypothetical protein